jgi:hypothetical protein
MKMTFAEMTRLSCELAEKLPPGVAGVIGIPRKGMLPATILAERMHLQLGDVDSYCRGGFLAGGKRRPFYSEDRDGGGPIVVVDDGVSPGAPSMNVALKRLRGPFPGQVFLSAAVWIPAGFPAPVDYWAARYETEAQFQEAEFLNTHNVESYAVDFDGVLCVDPPPGETDDEARWTRIFNECRPLYLPRLKPVGAIISARMEKYRDVCETWLHRWGCRYRELILSPARSVAERESAPVRYGRWKGEIFAGRRDLRQFIESGLDQAREIRRVSRKPVFCTATWEAMA